MGSSNIRDLLTSFSPSLDFFAISSGDGRIKVPKNVLLLSLKSIFGDFNSWHFFANNPFDFVRL